MAGSVWFGNGAAGQFGTIAASRVDWQSDTIKVSLHTAAYTPNQDTHIYFSTATNELSGGNYARQTLGSKNVTYDATTNTVALRAASTVFTNLTTSVPFQWALVWKDTGAAGTSPLLGYVDLGPQSVTAQDFTIAWDATLGVLKGVVS